MSGDVVLRLSGITKRFGSLVANEDISLSLARGEVLALLGECAQQPVDKRMLAAQLADIGAGRGRACVFGGVAVELVQALFAYLQLALALGQLARGGVFVVLGAAQKRGQTMG